MQETKQEIIALVGNISDSWLLDQILRFIKNITKKEALNYRK